MYGKTYRRYDQTDHAHSAPISPLATNSSRETFAYAYDEEAESEHIDAFEEYRREGPITPRQYGERYESPLEFWQPQLSQPRRRALAEMAIDFLSIPPTSCDVERAFSAGRRTINDFQHRTRHDLLDAKVCVGNWAAPSGPFLGSVDATIKKATEVMTAKMKGNASTTGEEKTVPSKRKIIEVRDDSDDEDLEEGVW